MCSSSLKRLVTFDHGGHNDTWQSRGYYGAWSHFQKEVTAFYANHEASEHGAEGENNSSDLKASDSFTLLMPQPPEHIFEPQWHWSSTTWKSAFYSLFFLLRGQYYNRVCYYSDFGLGVNNGWYSKFISHQKYPKYCLYQKYSILPNLESR